MTRISATTSAPEHAPETVALGYTITCPTAGEDDAGYIAINLFGDGENPWQAQVYAADGGLAQAEYFESELKALQWAASQLLAPVAGDDEPKPAEGLFVALDRMHAAYGQLHDLCSDLAEGEVEWSEEIRKTIADKLAGPCLEAMALAGTALAGDVDSSGRTLAAYRRFIKTIAEMSTLDDEFAAETERGDRLRDRYVDIEDYRSDLSDERLGSEFGNLEGVIRDAREILKNPSLQLPSIGGDEHPVVRFTRIKDILAKASECDKACQASSESTCTCSNEAADIFAVFGLDVPDLDTIEDGEVLGLCRSSGMLIQWNAENRSTYVSETLAEFGLKNLHKNEAARIGVPPADWEAANPK